METRFDPVYHSEKLAELVVYIASKTADKSSFGKTKINKTLFFGDFLHFRKHLLPITGASYEKQQYGPVPAQLEEVKANLVQNESISIKEVKVFNYSQQRITALREPDLSLFTPSEIEIIDELINTFGDHTASTISNYSHSWSTGWQLADDNELIPYETAFLTGDSITQEEVEMLQSKLKLSV